MLIVKNKIDKEGIELFESGLSAKLPSQFKSFLLKYNGGMTPNTSFEGNGVSTDIRAMYGVGKVDYSFATVREIDISGKIYLPCAVDSFGNEFLVELTETGSIYFMDHESDRSIRLVAQSLKEFFTLCKSKPISDAAKLSPEERERKLLEKGKGDNITDGLRDLWKKEYEKNKNIVQEEVTM